jgi:cysteine desulfurase
VSAARIYLDHAATTPLAADVLEAMQPYFARDGFNPSSIHAEGRRARAAIDSARERIAVILHCKPKEIIFTASGTEADNMAIIGAARAARARGKHVVTSAIEHHAVLHTVGALRDEGFEVTLLPVDSDGVVDRTRFAEALRDDTILATVMYANNEIGTIQPIAQLVEIARARGIVFLTDGVQAAGTLDLDVTALGVDALAISAHKLYGPKGVGALYVRNGTPLSPLIHGGGQERGRRAGTENVSGVIGMAKALELADGARNATNARVAGLRDTLEAKVTAAVPHVHVNARGVARLPGISSLAFAGVNAESLLIALDLAGVAASAGSACAAGSLEASHVIAALGEAGANGATLRLSLGRGTTAEEIERVASLLPSLVASQREGAALSV